ncbi:ABC-three component system protein [Oceanibacterium hippocampi]|uniref:ABC-three component systems C-terminal domain-containing protein n=1 Tax=Oceanibacterium hippocampi TaxID=745714 RepID=A0A1Y5SEH0_9PROT|nr:ABC-three component system protein [Oceanibacterium hippocampi]SLN38885.1 hypothetical protein OCH7691_01619 [Oceanibacterium hippocampi]
MNQDTKYSAGSSLAGYLFQCRLALLRGLELARKSPASDISIEKFDDISFETDDLAKCLIQAKHHITTKSVDNKSVDVWKTIGIWTDGFVRGVFQGEKTTCFLITTATAADGSALAKLRDGASEQDRADALAILRKAAEESNNKATESARKKFMKLSDYEAKRLIAKITVYDNHSNLTDVMSDIEAELVLIAPGKTGLAAQYLEGWWLRVVGEQLIARKSSTIPIQHIIIKASEIGRSLQKESLPLDDPDVLEVKEYSEDDERRIFVRQLRAIQISDRYIEGAVYDYYRAYAQRSKWARENLILENELGDYDRKLEDSWRRKFDGECISSEPLTETDRIKLGRLLYIWASQESVALRNIVEKWITAGSFHGLSDELRIRWHPEFPQLLKDAEMEDA